MSESLFSRTILNIKRSKARNIWVALVLVVNFTIFSLLLAFIYSTHQLSQYFIQKPEVIGFFKDEVTEEKILEMKKEIEGKDYVLEVVYTSKDQAMKNFIESNKEDKEIIESVSVNPFPAHLNVKVKSLDRINDISNHFKSSENISDVNDSQSYINPLKRIVLGIQIAVGVLLATFTFSSMIIIFLAISLNIYAFRNDIIVMKLVGATNFYVRTPYILQSLFLGICGVIGASFVTVPVILYKFNQTMTFLVGDIYIKNIGLIEILYGLIFLLLFAAFITVFSGFLATRRYIKY